MNSRAYTYSAAIAAAVLLAALYTPSGAQVRGRKTASFNPSGTFSVQNSPESPAPEIDGDLVQNIELRKTAKGYDGELSVMRRTGGMVTYKFTGAAVEPGKLSFTTASVRGISYGFEGRFLKQGNLRRLTETTTGDVLSDALEGTATRYRGGRKLGAAEFKFDFLLGG
jgi:hypothetical protein